VGIRSHTRTISIKISLKGKAYDDLINRYGWEKVTILYEDNNSMKRIKTLFERTSKVN
jgi:hypothetical protein